MDEFEIIFKRDYKKIYFYLKNLSCNDSQLAEDLTQEVFYKVLLYILANTNTNHNISIKWMMKVAHNQFIDYIRKNKNNLYHLGNFAETSQTEAEDLDFKMDIEIILNKLPPKYKALIILRDYFSFTYEEISLILGCNEPSVKSAIFRARRKFKEVYEFYER